jgi:hypothetical protein
MRGDSAAMESRHDWLCYTGHAGSGAGGRIYDAIGAEMGVSRMGGDERYIAWGVPGGGAGIGITLPFDGEPATVGNGVMVALEAKDQQQVDRLHALALSLGGTCEGAPGERFRLLRRLFPRPGWQQAQRLCLCARCR